MPAASSPASRLPAASGGGRRWRRAFRAFAVVLLAVLLLRLGILHPPDLPGVGGSAASAAADAENLADGYDGPPVVMAVAEPRAAAKVGVCFVVAVDRSGSMASAADPDGQVLQEIRAAFAAVDATSEPDDRAGITVFADLAQGVGPVQPGDPELAAVTRDRSDIGGGTMFVPALGAVATMVHACGRTLVPVVVIVSDGAFGDDADHVVDELRRLPSTTDVHLIALDHEHEFRGATERWWRSQPNVKVTKISELHAGSVAEAIADVLADGLKAPVLVGFRNP